MALKNLAATVDEPHVGRLDLLVRDLSELPRSQVRGLIDHGCVSVNGVTNTNSGHQIALGDQVTLCFDPHRRYKEKKRKWDDRTFAIIHEDEFIIVVDKAAGTLTVPTDNEDANTLVDRVSTYLNHSRRNKSAWIVHRLDRDISGLLVFAKQEAVGNSMIEQFKATKPGRVYTAIVHGVLAEESGEFTSPIETVNKTQGRRDDQPAELAVATTRYKVLKRGRDTTVVEIELESGIRHQIRSHFADAGHSILGDRRYGSEDSSHPRWIRKRMALHARTLSFVHPGTGQQVVYESPLPTAIAKFIAGIKQEKASGSAKPSPWDTAKRTRGKSEPEPESK